MKQVFSVVLLLFLLRGGSLLAQTVLTVEKQGGESYSSKISTASSITFFADSIHILPRTENSSEMVFSLSDVRKMVFSDDVNNSKVIEEFCFSLYPNPTSDSLVVDGIDVGNHMLTVYSTSGNKILQKPYRSGDYVDISSLAAGIYLVRVGNCVYKFVKE